MRLLSLNEHGGLAWKEFRQDEIPPYAILSHTWGTEEVTFCDLINNNGRSKAGRRKIEFCGEQAARDGLRYFWVDTCCIDKRDNNELTKSINSMFRWYRGATHCYVYLSDVSKSASDPKMCRSAWEADFRQSRWFTRGWTLQELLAPSSVIFYSSQHARLGNKQSLAGIISETTGIPACALRGRSLDTFSVEQRMSWAAKRHTTVPEDGAYCLLGIFNIFMPLIPGEGKSSAMKRLKREIKDVENVGRLRWHWLLSFLTMLLAIGAAGHYELLQNWTVGAAHRIFLTVLFEVITPKTATEVLKTESM
jgi:hypothetical protein